MNRSHGADTIAETVGGFYCAVKWAMLEVRREELRSAWRRSRDWLRDDRTVRRRSLAVALMATVAGGLCVMWADLLYPPRLSGPLFLFNAFWVPVGLALLFMKILGERVVFAAKPSLQRRFLLYRLVCLRRQTDEAARQVLDQSRAPGWSLHAPPGVARWCVQAFHINIAILLGLYCAAGIVGMAHVLQGGGPSPHPMFLTTLGVLIGAALYGAKNASRIVNTLNVQEPVPDG